MYFYSFNPTESPPRYSSVILPTCDRLDYCVFRTIDTGMYIFNNIDVRCQGLTVVNAMECYASEKNANHFLRMTLRLALFRQLPYFLYNDITDGNTYLYDLRNDVKKNLGKTVRTEAYTERQDSEAVLIYGEKVREVGNVPLMHLGATIEKRTPGIHEALRTKSDLEAKLLQ